jgi:hypothetical protein
LNLYRISRVESIWSISEKEKLKVA